MAQMHSQMWYLATPFTGVDGVGRANDNLDKPAVQTNMFEFAKHLAPLLRARFPGGFEKPKDLMTIPLDDWQSSDVMWISAPCQPHCRIGKGLGDKDPRSLPFWRALEATKALANREDRPLKMVIIENSPGIMDTKKKAGTCFYKLINAWWASQMPTWTTLKPLFWDARDSGTAMSRPRVFLRSLQLDFLKLVQPLAQHLFDADGGFTEPPRDWHLPLQPLARFLDEDLRPIRRQDVKGRKMWANIVRYRKHAQAAFTSGVEIFIVHADRDPDMAFGAITSSDVMMSLTTKNYYIVLYGEPGCRVAPKEGRWLSLAERSRLCGIPPDDLSAFLSKRQMATGLGNCVPVQVASTMLKPVAECMRIWNKVKATGSKRPVAKRRRLWAPSVLSIKAKEVCVA